MDETLAGSWADGLTVRGNSFHDIFSHALIIDSITVIYRLIMETAALFLITYNPRLSGFFVAGVSMRGWGS